MRLFTFGLVLALGCSTQPSPSVPSSGGKTDLGRVEAPSGALGGRVVETLDAPGYTYLKLATDTGELWAAIPTATVATGRQVTLVNPTPMKNFSSKTLNRSFALIMFATGISEGSAPAAAFDPAAQMAAAHAKGPAAPIAVVKVDKAAGPNSKTVAEIHDDRAILVDQPIVLRGQVVKYTPGVMGKNWLHLRDGSGSEGAKDNDLVVTTTEQAALGEVVTISGKVHLGRDFGSGYVFPVIVEDARLTR